MNSIIQTEKICYITGQTVGLHKHHIFEGTANRKLSEKYGLFIWLIPHFHNMSDDGIHVNKDFDKAMKMIAQSRFIETYPDLDFQKIFGKNYL